MDDEFLYSEGLNEGEVFFYTNLILNTYEVINELCNDGSFIDHIIVRREDDKTTYSVDFVNDNGFKNIGGIVSVETNSYLFKNWITDGEKEYYSTDEFLFLHDIVTRDSVGCDGIENMVVIDLYDNEELTDVLSMIAEAKYHRISLQELSEEQRNMVKNRESEYNKKLLIN